MDTLETLGQQVNVCTDCPLSQGRTHAVPGEGSGKAGVMLIGEAPGYNEDQQGRPFVGPAGQFLDQLLQAAGLRREDVYITNMVKCRPPNNRDPFPGEIQACKKYLDRQVELLKPRVVVTLGRHSLARFFPKETISKARGRPRQAEGLTVFPMYHPAAALHQQSLQRIIEEDFLRLPSLLTDEPAPQEAGDGGQQLTMF